MTSSNNPTKEVGDPRLTRDGRLKADPVFITSGQELVFTVQETPTQMSLMRLKLADGSVERLHSAANTTEFEATFSSDGRYYAFVRNQGNLNLKLVIRDTESKKDVVYDPGAGFSGVRRPSFAPDGSRVVFGKPTSTGQQLFTVDNQAKNLQELTKVSLNNWPAFAPDGKHIVFSSSRDGNYDLYVMDADGGSVHRLTKSPGLDIRPAWSPDGKRIAFTSNRDGNYEIYLMNADGSDQRRLTKNDERDDYAAWQPDGKRLVIVSERGGRSDLYWLEVPD